MPTNPAPNQPDHPDPLLAEVRQLRAELARQTAAAARRDKKASFSWARVGALLLIILIIMAVLAV